MKHVTYFVTPHGFGHASRAAACMVALQRRWPELAIQIVTKVPLSFFLSSGVKNISYVSCLTDVGLVQRSPVEEDLSATLLLIEKFLAFNELGAISNEVKRFSPERIFADISPLGLRVAQELSIKSVLIENFTWDWLYQGYLNSAPALSKFIPIYSTLYELADLHVQVTPVCAPTEGALTLPPLVRPLIPEWQLPDELNANEPFVLVSMGGIPSQEQPAYLAVMERRKDLTFVTSGQRTERHGNVITFAASDQRYYHPNLVRDASVVVSKAGSGTVSEVYYAAVPFVVVERPLFRESRLVIDWIGSRNPTVELDLAAFESGSWIEGLHKTVASAPVRARDEVQRQRAQELEEAWRRLLGAI